jgi:hypothetical protein
MFDLTLLWLCAEALHAETLRATSVLIFVCTVARNAIETRLTAAVQNESMWFV